MQLFENIQANLPTILFLSGIVTLVMNGAKRYLPEGMSERAYTVAVNVVAALVGIVISGILGNINIFDGVMFYGTPIPPIAGLILTGASYSLGSAFWHNAGEILRIRTSNVIQLPGVIEMDVDEDDGSTSVKTSTNVTAQSGEITQSYTRFPRN